MKTPRRPHLPSLPALPPLPSLHRRPPQWVAELAARIPEGPVVPPPPPEAPALARDASGLPTVRTHLPHHLTVSLSMAALVVAMAGLHAVGHIAAPVFLAINLAITSYPLNTGLRRRGVPAVISATLTGLLVIAALLAFFVVLGWSISALVLEMPRYIPKFERMYADAMSALEAQGITQQQILDTMQDAAATQWQNLAQQGLGLLQGVLSNLTGVVSLLLVLITVLFFITMDMIGFGARLDAMRTTHPRVAATVSDFAHGVRRYWVVTTAFGLIVAVLDVWVLLYLGVPLALVWGVVSFLTNYIPNIGFVIGVVPPALLALLDRGPTTAIAVVLAYSVLNFVIQSLIQPKVAGDAIGVTPTVAIISLLFWTWLLGPLGALLALPATLLLKAVLVDGDRQAGWLNYVIASRPENIAAPPSEPATPQEPGARMQMVLPFPTATPSGATATTAATAATAGGAPTLPPAGGQPRD
ncbi:AI-2E family transporter [Gephyromycinifex aptenodytis]|uniref:AI-2E family transporter n=1 Tax=Gephyromycinifex aptenodytis TaxID=2716227 RepID=UPI001448646E|nr:AI-2E family transporter [Gephyromycinifex aptenodytis]